jgi:aspartate-semialdehyde dehydrogenase
MKIPVAILGATGSVGQYFISLLENHPWFEIKALFASKSYDTYAATWRATLPRPNWLNDATVTNTQVDKIIKSGARIVFSALPGELAGSIESALQSKGIAVFSNASAHRMDGDVPIIIPEINSDHFSLQTGKKGILIANSNCTTAGLVMGLAPLMPLGIKSVRLATYQALSGAGYPGVPSMDILGNVIPHIGGEEEKIETESRKILGNLENGSINPLNADIQASVFRVAVANGHMESIFVELDTTISASDLQSLYKNFEIPEVVSSLPSTPFATFKIFDHPSRPQPIKDCMEGKGMTVSIGSLKARGTSVSMKLLVNNVIRGAAGGSVQNAELALQKGLIKQ